MLYLVTIAAYMMTIIAAGGIVPLGLALLFASEGSGFDGAAQTFGRAGVGMVVAGTFWGYVEPMRTAYAVRLCGVGALLVSTALYVLAMEAEYRYAPAFTSLPFVCFALFGMYLDVYRVFLPHIMNPPQGGEDEGPAGPAE